MIHHRGGQVWYRSVIFITLLSALLPFPAHAHHDVTCKGVAPRDSHCSRTFVAESTVIGTRISGNISTGAVVATFRDSAGRISLVACPRLVVVGGCYSRIYLYEAGTQIDMDVRVIGSGRWSVTLLLDHDENSSFARVPTFSRM